MTVSEVMEQVLRDRKAYANSGGGLTISGGEPTYKQSEFAIELLHAAKDEGIHTAIESCMMTARRIVENMIPIVDYFICDVKILDEKRHEEATGAKNAAILDNIRYIAATGQSMLIRTPLIPGFTDGADNIAAIGEFVASLGGNVEMELLNANPLYFQKYDYSGESIDRSMGKKLSEKQMNELNDILRRKGVKVI